MVTPQTMVQLGSEGGPVFHQRGPYLVHLADFGPGIVYVGKIHGGSAEDAVFQRYPFKYGDVVLNLAPLTDNSIRSNYHVLADVAVFAYR